MVVQRIEAILVCLLRSCQPDPKQTPGPRGVGFTPGSAVGTGGGAYLTVDGGGGGGSGSGAGGASYPGVGEYCLLASFPPRGIGTVMAVIVDCSFPRRSTKGDTFCKVTSVSRLLYAHVFSGTLPPSPFSPHSFSCTNIIRPRHRAGLVLVLWLLLMGLPLRRCTLWTPPVQTCLPALRWCASIMIPAACPAHASSGML